MAVPEDRQAAVYLEVPLERGRLGRALAWSGRFVRYKPLAAFGGIVVIAMIVMAIFAPQIAPYPYDKINIPDRLEGPSGSHIMGTDEMGRDLASRIIYGARSSVFVGFGAIFISSVLATLVGSLSGYYGGRLDTLVQRVVDVWIAFPGLVLIISVIAVIGQGMAQIIVVLGVLMAARSSRVIRGAVIGIINNQYVEAARVIGANDARIIARYILPNVFATIIVLATVQVGSAILIEATISFLGYGIPPPTPTWGQMLSQRGSQYMLSQPWIAVWPGVAISMAVFAFNMFGDGLRDVLDPRLRGRR